jgi:drug/metabolite transporter (DMT)-like permease
MFRVILFGLGAAVTWALGSVMVKGAVGKFAARELLFVRALGGAITAVGVMLALGNARSIFQIPPIAGVAILGATLSGYFAADLLFVRSLEVVPLSQALPIQATYPVIAAAIAWAVLDEPPAGLAVVGAIGVALGVVAVTSVEPETDSILAPGVPTRRTGLALLGLSTVGWGISAVLLRFALQMADAISVNALISVLVLILFAATSRPSMLWGNVRRGPAWAWWVAAAGVLGGTGVSNLLFVMAVESGGVITATALACTAPLFSSVLAALTLRERIGKRLATGVLLTVGGVLLIVGT